MMAELRTQFGGLNTSLDPNRLRNGTADVAMNVTRDLSILQKRGGFAELEDNVDGSATLVKNMAVAEFANGDMYVVC